MSVYTTDDVATWGYAYDTTGGDPAPIAGSVTVKPDPTKEYAAGGNGFEADSIPLALPDTIDDYTRAFGFRGYELMLTQPACFASVQTLKLGIMPEDIRLIETHPRKAGQEEPDAKQKQSQEVKDFCQRLIDRVPGFRQSVLQLYDCAPFGNKLGEKVSRIETIGPDAGKLVMDRLNVKKRQSWQFIVDGALNVNGILVKRKGANYARIRPDKFVWFTWMPRDNDPRGTSILRAAYTAWNVFTQLYPQYFKALKQFAAPSLLGVTAPDAGSESLEGKTVTPEEYMLAQLVRFQNGSAMAVANGADVRPIAIPGNGNSFLDAFNFLNQEIVYAMLLQTRATREAQHGSKADSQTGGDILTLLIEYGRSIGSEAIRNSILKFYVRENFGIEVAEEFTPYVSFGAGEKADFIAGCNALANMMKAGLITPSNQAEMYALFNLPIPDPKVDAKLTPKPEPSPVGGKEAENPDEDEAEFGKTPASRGLTRAA
jgi:hypothetical protein